MSREAYGSPLLEYAGMVWKRRYAIVLVVLAMAIPAWILSARQAPVYTTTAELVLGQERLDADFNAVATDLSDRQMATQIRVLTGNEVSELARSRGATGTVSGSNPTLSNVLLVQSYDGDPEGAARTANAYSEAYIEFRTTELQGTLDAAAEQLRQRIALLQEELAALSRQAAAENTGLVLQRGLQEQQAALQAQLGQL